LQVENVPQAGRLYETLSAKGRVNMALQATAWATRFAVFTDQFGVSWMINCNDDAQVA
jgi:PhnB protein